MKIPPSFPLFVLSTTSLFSAQSIGTLDGPAINIEIIPLTTTCVAPGDTFSFEVVTRWGAGGTTTFGIGNIDYLVDLGVTTITFQGVNADGSFISAPSSTSGAVSGFMVDVADADNEFIPSTAPGDFGVLNASDTLDRPDSDPTNSWDSDWVIRLDWTVPLDASPGTYAVTGMEEVDIFQSNGDIFPDAATASFPGIHTPFSICVVPEPSSLALCLIGLVGLCRRSRS